ncbi:MAG: lactonase family protein [Solobacterium sp.]|nr:lactonase family protein [Solobacterium sp.]
MERILYAGTVGSKKTKGSISGSGEGVYAAVLNDDFSVCRLECVPADNAGIICMSKDGRYIYAANESKDFGGLNGSGGGVSAYRTDGEGGLQKLNESISYGSRTSYVCLSEDERFLLASNHGSHTTVVCRYVPDGNGGYKLERGFDDSSAAVFRINDDGSIGELTDLKVFKGSGYWCRGGGQSTAHLHCIRAKGDLVFACNRGCDEIEVMRLDADGKLSVLEQYRAEPALAPRHMDLHPSMDLLYVCNENYPCISVYAVDPVSGRLTHLQTEGTQPASYYAEKPLPHFTKRHADRDEKNSSAMGGDRSLFMPADIHVSPDGRFVYVSNRRFGGQADISVFAIKEDGTVSLQGITELDGSDPRGFNLNRDGSLLFAGLLDKNTVTVYAVDRKTGMPEGIKAVIAIPSPASFRMDL